MYENSNTNNLKKIENCKYKICNIRCQDEIEKCQVNRY